MSSAYLIRFMKTANDVFNSITGPPERHFEVKSEIEGLVMGNDTSWSDAILGMYDMQAGLYAQSATMPADPYASAGSQVQQYAQDPNAGHSYKYFVLLIINVHATNSCRD